MSLWFRKWLWVLVLHLFCRVMNVKADPTLKLVFPPQVWLNLDDHWSTHQIRSLHTRQHKVQSWEVCWDLHCKRDMSARGSEGDHFWSRVTVCRSFLGATARVPRDSLDLQFGLPPADGWPNRESKPNFIQQQQPKEYEDATIWDIIWMRMPHTAQLEPAWWNILVVGTRICHGLNFHSTTATKRVWRCHHLRHYMDENATHRSIGASQERKLYLVETLLMRPKQRYAVFKTT
jgi:hypothetical protein